MTDSWGEAAPNLSGKTLSLVLADSGQAQESSLSIQPGNAAPTLPLGWVLLMALAGGLILNVMPCVLPVLAMKMGTLMQTERQARGQVRRQFLASVAGIVISFLALALMMTVLRLGNQALGWGIQFQNPWFIAAMALVMVLFSASLLGLFEIRLPSGASTFLATRGGNGLAGHFWQGAFATLLATPCTAPFLGTAVSVALAAPLPLLWGIFLAMGIGMSLPWLLVAAWPGLALRLPRPGRWMNVVRIVLGMMMLRHYAGRATDPCAAAGHRLALPLANGTARRGISCTGGRGSRVCFRLRRRGLPPRSYSLAAAQRAGHCPRAGGEQTGVRRRDRRLVRDL